MAVGRRAQFVTPFQHRRERERIPGSRYGIALKATAAAILQVLKFRCAPRTGEARSNI
ncbi:hypothetical protein O9992_20150 [Vibrio lentus]|nr:hypothetical protein [Vibrio lentus]